MRSKQTKSISKRWLTLIGVLLLAVIVVCSFTACSIFTDSVKGLFKGESAFGGQNNDAAVTNKPADTTQTGDADSDDTGEDPEDTKNNVVDPPVEVNSNYVTINSSLSYDKASHDDLTLSATHPNMSYYQLLGMGLVNDGDYANVRIDTTTLGASSVQVDGQYLSSLDAGNYYFYYIVSETKGHKTVLHYDPFRLEITNSSAKPTDVKIDYDVDCPNVYVTFCCDCGGAHTVSFDGVSHSVEEGVTRYKFTSVDKSASHNAVVKCTSSNQSTSVSKSSPESAAVSNGYLNYKYSFSGHKADGYIEDDGEAADLLEYLAYEGSATEMKVYVSSAIYNAINANATAYLTSIQSKIVVPWSLKFSISYSAGNKEVTFKVIDTNAGAVLHTGYEDSRISSDLGVVIHCEEKNTRDREGDLPIDAKKKVSVRNVKELLKVVEKGYCPVAADSTLTLYNKARNFCYTYLTDDMSDVEKLHIIYDYLAGNVNYDYSALNLFTLIDEIKGMTLSNAQAKLTAEIADDSNGFSDSMKAVITSARDTATSTSDLVKKLKTDYLQKLAAFSIEGVFDDGTAVCEGISYAYMLLARIEGIECYQITGLALQGTSQVAHAWNKVHVDGAWYCVDATWGSVYLNNVKYVSHRYFMVDESVFDTDHKESIEGVGYGVKNLALGDAEYYKSVETATGHSLYVSNNADLKKAIAYYVNGGSNYVEVLINPVYQPSSTDFMLAYHEVTGHNCTYSSLDDSRVFIAYFTQI